MDGLIWKSTGHLIIPLEFQIATRVNVAGKNPAKNTLAAIDNFPIIDYISINKADL